MTHDSRKIYTHSLFARAGALILLVAILAGLSTCFVNGKRVAFKTVDKGEGGGGDAGRRNYVITNIDDWKPLCNALKPSVSEVDFTQKMIIAVFQGTRKSGGYAIEISRVTETEDALEVFVKETFPPPGSIVTDQITSPYHIIETQKIGKTCVFKDAGSGEVFDVVTPKMPFRRHASGPKEEARTELERLGVEYSGASFLESAENGDITAIELLLKAGMYPEVRGEREETALMVAARDGKVDILNLLIEAGAEVDATAFMIAAAHAQTEVVRALLRVGVDVNARAYNGSTALTAAAVRGHAETVMALIAAGADVEAKDAHGDTALVLAAREGHTRPACEGHTNIVRALLDAGADANARFHGRTSALILAAYGGCIEMVHDLLRAGADVNARGWQGDTALHKATMKGYAEIVKALIEAGADVNVRDNNPWTVLIHAASLGHTEIVQALIDAGADVNAADRDGSTALIFMMRTPRKGREHIEIAKALIHAGADVNARERWDGWTALMLAARQGRTEIAKALLDAGADVNAADRDGRTPLMHAEERGCTEIVQLLRYGRVDKKSERSEDEAKKVDQATIVDDTEWAEFEVRTVFDPAGAGDYVASVRLDGRSQIVSEGDKFGEYEVLRIDGPKKCITIIKGDSKNEKVFCVGDKRDISASSSGSPLTKEGIGSDTEAIAKGNSLFALNLYNNLKDRQGNLFFSPYSISTALAMTYAGARGNTEKQMAEVLNFTLDQERLHHGFGSLEAQLNAVQEKGNVELSVANALWVQKDYDFIGDFLDLIQDSYRAGLNRVDFKNAPDAVGTKINKWVERKTKKKIKDLIKPGVLDPLTRLVLTNAIYFKGNWASQFDQKRTKTEPFWLNPDKSVDVPMMNQRQDFRYMENDVLQMLEMLYIGNELSMIVLLPKEIDGLAQIENVLSADNVNAWLSGLRKREVLVILPKFKMTFELDLVAILGSMGMPNAFDRRVADFSGMAEMKNEERLYISAAIHKAFVDVNEEGTEAAAATAFAVGITSVQRGPVLFRADHPFVFLIRHNASGSILFLGRIVNPTE